MSMGNIIKEKYIKWAYDGDSVVLTAPTTWEISLHTADPLDDDSAVNELVGSGYARKEFTPSIGASPNFEMTNPIDLEWSPATADWLQATHVVVRNKATGAMLDHGALTTPRTILNEGVFRLKAGELDTLYS